MLLMHRSACALGPQPHPLVAAPEPHLPCRRHNRRNTARRTLAAAVYEDDTAANLHHERDGSATASTSGLSQLRSARSSSPRSVPSTLQPMPVLPRDVRAHVAAHMPSTQHSKDQQPPMPFIYSTRASGNVSNDAAQLPTALANGAVVPTTPAATASLLPIATNPITSTPASPETTRLPADFNDKELYEEIKACDTWQDVLEVIADEAPAISLHTASQAASKLVPTIRMSPMGILKATSMLHVQPAFTTLLGVLSSGIPRMSRAQLCNSLQALAQLKVTLDDATLAAYALRTQQLAPTFNARDISQLLHGYGTLKRSPGTPVLDIVGFRAKVLLEDGEFEPQSLSMMMTGLAALDYKNHLLLGSAASVATLRMAEFTPQGVANVCFSLAKLGHLSIATLASAGREYTRAHESYKTQEVCNLLWAMTHQRFHPQEALALMVRSLVQRSSSLRPVDCAMLFHALGTFGVHPGNQMLSELLNPMPRQLQRFSAAELCSVLWGLGLIGETRQATFSQIAGLLPDHFEGGRMNDGLLRQAFQAFLCSKLEDVMNETDSGATGKKVKPSTCPAFPPIMMEAMKRAWKASALANTVPVEAAKQEGREEEEEQAGVQGKGVQAQATGSLTRKSHDSLGKTIKQEVAAIIKGLRVVHELRRPSKDGLVMIDVAIKAGEERFIALQVVMEHEHTCNTGQFLGPLQFQTQVLEMNGWEVRHIRAKDLKSLDWATKPLFIADLLRGMGVRVAGARDGAQRGGAAAGRGAGAGAQRGGAGGKPASGLDMLMAEGDTGANRRKGK